MCYLCFGVSPANWMEHWGNTANLSIKCPTLQQSLWQVRAGDQRKKKVGRVVALLPITTKSVDI